MNSELSQRLSALCNDYQSVTNAPFDFFFCPILYLDEEVELCKAHIINQAFPNTSRKWTIQRKDVDNFYGSVFESDFIMINERGKLNPFEALKKKSLHPKISLDEKLVEYYHYSGNEIRDDFTPIVIDNENTQETLILKLDPAEVEKHLTGKWEIEYVNDLRISAVVSLIKMGHLTLFELFGYHYVFSRASHLIGKKILGDFFLMHYGRSKKEIIDAGKDYFTKYQKLVRPVLTEDSHFQSSVESKHFLICQGFDDLAPWAFIVFMKFGNQVHACLIPYIDNSRKLIKFNNFLHGKNEIINYRRAYLNENVISIQTEIEELIWPQNIDWDT